MSTTFTCPEAPRLQGSIPCRSEPCTPEERCSFCEDGIELVDEPEDPISELNLNSGNAATLLKIVGLWSNEDGEPHGELQHQEIPTIMQRILVASNRPSVRAPFHVSCVDEDETGRARLVSFGVTDEEILERLFKFRDLLEYAHENEFFVRWG